MVPDKFNMVDMEGIDIITSQGEVVEGLYQKLVESITQCRYQCLYNWKFDGILIPPTYVEMDIVDDVVWINEGVCVDEEDVVRVYSLEPPAPEPNILELSVTENGTYFVPEGYDGYNPVSVEVPAPVLNSLSVTKNGTYTPPTGVDGFSSVEVNVASGSATPFIESQATANFDTSVPGNTIYKIEYEFMPVSIINSYQWYAGAANNNFTLASMTGADGVSKGFIRVGNVDFGIVTFNLGAVNKLVCENGSVYLNDSQISGSYSGPINTTSATLKLLGGGTNSHSRMFSCKLYDQNGNLLKNYVPFLDQNFVACLKDLVSDSLLYPTLRRLTFGYAISRGF